MILGFNRRKDKEDISSHLDVLLELLDILRIMDPRKYEDTIEIIGEWMLKYSVYLNEIIDMKCLKKYPEIKHLLLKNLLHDIILSALEKVYENKPIKSPSIAGRTYALIVLAQTRCPKL